jgi:hypothetical protein
MGVVRATATSSLSLSPSDPEPTEFAPTPGALLGREYQTRRRNADAVAVAAVGGGCRARIFDSTVGSCYFSVAVHHGTETVIDIKSTETKIFHLRYEPSSKQHLLSRIHIF